jgi:hypothetical protein
MYPKWSARLVFVEMKKKTARSVSLNRERNGEKKVYSLDKVLIYDEKFFFLSPERRQYNEAVRSLYSQINKGRALLNKKT